MALLHYLWSRTAASNANADSNVNWQEGQAPSSVNDSARSMMASLAGYRDDIAGAITTGGTSTAYTITSYQVFDTLAHMDGQVIAFTPHATNGATVTLNVDGLGAKPLRSAPSIELLAGTLILGTPYTALYNHSAGVWYLHNFFGNPYNIPLLAGIDYWGTTAPNSSFVFPTGQAVSRTTYAAAFAIVGTTYGAGDGSTTFNLPDKRGRVSAATDTMGGVAASRLTDVGAGFGDTLGEAGGAQTTTLITANLPAYTPTGSNSGGAATFTYSGASFQPGSNLVHGVSLAGSGGGTTVTTTFTQPTITMNAQGGTSTAFTNVPPTICCNYIIRII